MDQVPLWMALPTTTLYKILMKKKESMTSKSTKTHDIEYKTQKDAEIAWMKATQPKEVLDQINWNEWRI